MNELNWILTGIEKTESETETNVEKKNETEEKEAAVRTAIEKLQEDVALLTSVEKVRESIGQEQQIIERELDNCRNAADTLEVQLQEMNDTNQRSYEKTMELAELGIDTEGALEIIENRKEVIREYMDRLNSIREKLNMPEITLSDGYGTAAGAMDRQEQPVMDDKIPEAPDTHIESQHIEPARKNLLAAKLEAFRNKLKSSLTKDKTESFRIQYEQIDTQMNDLHDQLLKEGIPEYSLAMYNILRDERCRAEADLLRKMNGEATWFQGAMDVHTLAEEAKRRGEDRMSAPQMKPARKLSQTAYGFTKQTVQGITAEFYNDPNDLCARIIQEQGNSVYTICGDCGMVSSDGMFVSAGMFERANENYVISNYIAYYKSEYNGLDYICAFEKNPDYRGGTTPRTRQDFMSHMGLETYMVSMKKNSLESVEKVSNFIRDDHSLILSVDAGVLWNDIKHKGDLHAVQPVSVSKDGTLFVVNDTGIGKVIVVDREHLAESLSGNPANVTVNIVR